MVGFDLPIGGAAVTPLGGDDRFQPARESLEEKLHAAGRQLPAMGKAHRRGKFGQAGLVVVRAEDELGDRRHRGAGLLLDPAFGEKFGIFLSATFSDEGKVVRPRERSVESAAATGVGGQRNVGICPCGRQPFAQRVIFFDDRDVEVLTVPIFVFVDTICSQRADADCPLAAGTVCPDRDHRTRWKLGGAVAHLALEGIQRGIARYFLPVDHPINEVDGIVIGRERQQNAPIKRIVAAHILEFGLKADWRAVGDDLQMVIG